MFLPRWPSFAERLITAVRPPAGAQAAYPRRVWLALAALPWLGALLPSGARAEGANLTGEALSALKLSAAGVTIDIAPLADTGFSVPLSASLVAPTGRRIASVDVYLPVNPNTRALTLNLPEPQPRFAFSTRLRLAGTQDVWVVATLDDGSRVGASANTVVTSSACFDGS